MQNKQLCIDGWKHQSIQNNSPHRSQLKNFVEYIYKANFESLSLRDKIKSSIFTEQILDRDERSYQSVKQKKQRFKTLPQRTKLRSFVEHNQETISDAKHNSDIREQKSQNKLKPLNVNNFATLQDKQKPYYRESIKKIYNVGMQKTVMVQQKRFKSESARQFLNFNGLIRRSITKKQMKQSESQKKQFDIRALVMVSNEQRMKKLKTILFKTIQDKKTSKCSKQDKKYEIRLKNMLQKSNRKKRKLEKLFKDKQWVNESKIETIIEASKIYHINTTQSAKFLQSKEKIDVYQGSARKNPSFYQYLRHQKYFHKR